MSSSTDIILTAFLTSCLLLQPGSAYADHSTESPARMTGQAVSFGSSTLKLTLHDAVALAVRGNRSISSAYFARVAQKFDLRVEEDRFSPKILLTGRGLGGRSRAGSSRTAELGGQLSLLGEYGTKVELATSGALHEQGSRNTAATVTIIQPLLRGSGREFATASRELARLAERANRLNLEASVADVVTEVIYRYREVIRAQEQLGISRNSLKRAKDMLGANEALIAAGRMAAYEIVQTEADVANIEFVVEEAGNQLDFSRLELLRLLGLNLDLSVVAIDPIAPQRVDGEYRDLVAEARATHPRYLQQLIARDQALINLKSAFNARLWDVSLVGGSTQNSDRGSLNTSRTWNHFAGVQVSVPLGDLSYQQAEVRAQVNVDMQAVAIDEAERGLESEVGNGVRDLGARWRQYEIAKRARELSQRKLDIEREKLQVGRSSNFQVLSFESDLRASESALLNAGISYVNAQTGLDRAIGRTLRRWEIQLND